MKPKGTPKGIFSVSTSNGSARQQASLRVRHGPVVVALIRSEKHSQLLSYCRNNPQSDETKSLREQLFNAGYTQKDFLDVLS